MAEMDPETQAHIEAQRRPPERKEPRRLNGDELEPHQRKPLLPELEDELRREREAAGYTSATAVDEQGHTPIPASDYLRSRREREHERVVAVLNRIAPAIVDLLPGGPRLTISVPCSGCGKKVALSAEGHEETETPGIMRARMLAAGWLRTAPLKEGGRFSGVMCDRCGREAEAEEREREVSAEHSSRLTDACLPNALQGFTFEDMFISGLKEGDRQRALSAARTWAAEKRVEDKPGLLIFGQKGSGKTRLAATTAWQRLRTHSVRWVSWPALAGQLLGAFDDDDRKVAISVLNGTQALVLDDIARDDIQVSDWIKTQLFTAIDKRVQAGTPLLLTTNLTGTLAEPDNPLAAIADRLGASIASRLAGYCRVVELPGNDHRLTLNYDGTKPKSKAELEAAREGLQEPQERDE